VDTDEVRRELGWSATTDMDTGIAGMARAFRAARGSP